jgi:hypothetical protein
MNIVYILFFDNFIKVGKASGNLTRLCELERTYGSFDKELSYVLVAAEHEDVFDIEKTLHKSLSKFKYKSYIVKGKSGYTELFDVGVDAINNRVVALSHLFDLKIVPMREAVLEGITPTIGGELKLVQYQLDYFKYRLQQEKLKAASLVQEITEVQIKNIKREAYLRGVL